MEGYLTQERFKSFYGSSDALVVAVFILTAVALTTSNVFKILNKGVRL